MKHLPNVLNEALRVGNLNDVKPGIYTVQVKSVHIDKDGCAQIEFNNESQNIQFTQKIRPVDDEVAEEIDRAKLAILDHIEKLATAIDHVVVSQELWEENEELVHTARCQVAIPDDFIALPQEYLELHDELAAALVSRLVETQTGTIADYDRWVKVAERFNKAAGQIGQCLVAIPGVHASNCKPRGWGDGLEPAPVEFVDAFREAQPPIPSSVYWSQAFGTFVDYRGIAYSPEFHKAWIHRSSAFPVFTGAK